MKRCTCRPCRDRDMRRFWRTIGRSYKIKEWTRLTLEACEPSPRTTRTIGLPAIPVWDGGPRELRLPRREGS